MDRLIPLDAAREAAARATADAYSDQEGRDV